MNKQPGCNVRRDVLVSYLSRVRLRDREGVIPRGVFHPIARLEQKVASYSESFLNVLVASPVWMVVLAQRHESSFFTSFSASSLVVGFLGSLGPAVASR